MDNNNREIGLIVARSENNAIGKGGKDSLGYRR